jgi:hypothetical protein
MAGRFVLSQLHRLHPSSASALLGLACSRLTHTCCATVGLRLRPTSLPPVSKPLSSHAPAHLPDRACSPRAGSPPRRVLAQRAARLALTHANATSLSSFSSNAIHLHHVTKVLLTFYSTGKFSTSIGQLIA